MQEFINIFVEMGWASGILLIIGAILLIAECLTPGFNVAGFFFFFCLFLGIIARIAEGASLTQTLLLILIVAIVIGVLFGLFIKSAKSGALSRTPIIETGTAVPEDYGELKNKFLLGKMGITKTFCKPVGKIIIDNQVYEAITSYGYIDANKSVVVEKVDHDYLYIRQIEDKTELEQNKSSEQVEPSNEVADNKQTQANEEKVGTSKQQGDNKKSKTTAKSVKKADK